MQTFCEIEKGQAATLEKRAVPHLLSVLVSPVWIMTSYSVAKRILPLLLVRGATFGE
jgi:hypothetical protein